MCCKRTRRMESLPDDLLSRILVILLVEDIYDSARLSLVCRKWHRMISSDEFIYAHLHQSKHTLLFRVKSAHHLLCLSARDDGRLQISKMEDILVRTRLEASCNGLVLDVARSRGNLALCVLNPLTKHRLVLPHPRGIDYWRCGIAWRSFTTAHISFEAKMALKSSRLVTTRGFVHWCARDDGHVLTLDIETETVKEAPSPVPVFFGGRWDYLPAGKYLTLLAERVDYLWDVWEMRPGSMEWRKVASFSLEDQKLVFEDSDSGRDVVDFKPVAWLLYPEVVVFVLSGWCYFRVFIYNLATRVIESIELPEPCPPSTRASKKLETMKTADANPTTAALLKKSSKNKKMDRVETSVKESSRDLSMFKFKSGAHDN
ncbi:Protein of unknown function DUF106-transmembrane [Striga hermonthica]|uniref:F-box domain-containing protein n=1 Tax=Striga hermonthica TaxID=68872 RepID=A0A9N7MXL1_STRHE|nr:Protein of unknown function DUF106-transmembrane [Striga hermonthica]